MEDNDDNDGFWTTNHLPMPAHTPNGIRKETVSNPLDRFCNESPCRYVMIDERVREEDGERDRRMMRRKMHRRSIGERSCTLDITTIVESETINAAFIIISSLRSSKTYHHFTTHACGSLYHLQSSPYIPHGIGGSLSLL